MLTLDSHASGRHFLHIPGPSPVPDRVLRAISAQTIDHRGPEFGAMARRLLSGIQQIFQTTHPVIIYSGSGTASWEAAFVNTLSPHDTILIYETGHFSMLWKKLAERLGLHVEYLEFPGITGWRRGVDAAHIFTRLENDTAHTIKAVCVVHNETSTGVISNIAAVREAIDAAKHPALLMVDAVSGLACAEYRHEAWGVDVTVAGSQKGLMLPPGLGFNAISPKALDASKTSTMPKAFWAWDEYLQMNAQGYWPTTPATNLLYGLHEVIDMILGEGLQNVFQRHQRLASACRAAIEAWGLQVLCEDPACYSPVSTAVYLPEGYDADALRQHILSRYNLSLGMGLGKLKGRAYRIGHLGDCNALSLMAALSGCEMGMRTYGIPLQGSGLVAAQEHLA